MEMEGNGMDINQQGLYLLMKLAVGKLNFDFASVLIHDQGLQCE